jgi:hypothetical protein
MSIKLLTSMRRVVLAAAAGLLLFAGSANAIIFVGNWDPSFGDGFPNLGFRGQSTFDVSSGCLTSPGFHSDNGDNCIITLLTASLDLYNASLGSGAPTLQTLIYAPPAIDPDPLDQVFVNAALTVTGVNMSTFIGPQFDTSPATGYSGPLFLQFILDPNGSSNAFIFTGDCSEGCSPDLSNPSNPAAIRISVLQVPEPGSLALLFGALGAGWLARRLRKR